MAAPWGFVDFTKLLFALSSLVQPLKRVRSIPEHFFVILSQHKACAGRFREETPSTSCTGVCLAITMLQYYICVGIVLTVVLVLGLGLGLGFGIILYFVIGT